jgi:hypothetical protein
MKSYRDKPKSPRCAVHIVPGLTRIPGSRRCIMLLDRLSCGPSHVRVTTHLEGRTRYYRDVLTATLAAEGEQTAIASTWASQEVDDELNTPDRLRTALDVYPREDPVVLWTSDNCSDRISFWWTLDALQTIDAESDRFWVADSIPTRQFGTSLQCHTEEMIARSFTCARPLTKGERRAGASLWRKFSDTSPRLLDLARTHNRTPPKDQRVLETLLYWGVPRIQSGVPSWLMLSALDEALLNCLNQDSWTVALQVIVGILRNNATEVLFDAYGDNFLAHRLSLWSKHHQEDPAVVAEPVKGKRGLTTGIAYKLTERGRSFIEQGMHRTDDAPVFDVGGCKVYDARRPWARVIRSDRWTIELARQS